MENIKGERLLLYMMFGMVISPISYVRIMKTVKSTNIIVLVNQKRKIVLSADLICPIV